MTPHIISRLDMKNFHTQLPKIAIAAIILSSFWASHWLSSKSTNPKSSDQPSKITQRIISLAPSITETLFALGLGDQVVGVTRFCQYPAAVSTITKVGGYSDPSYETIVALQPSLIVSLAEHEKTRRQLAPFGINNITLNNRSIEGIIDSIETVGAATNKTQNARRLTKSLREEIKLITEKTSQLRRPRVLITVGRQPEDKQINDIFVAGNDGFYSQMITIAGGQNAYKGDMAFPTLSGEGIINLNPDIIIDIIPNLKEQSITELSVLKQWKESYDISATRNNRVHVLTDNYMVIPGPRFIQIIRQLLRIIHPDIPLNDEQ